ncbi:MAG: hypothetical protein JWO05_2206 [Gemmatimonadetes bacterium]|nr:hypothetical protein [Gemmatimonadota bacterium]
MKRPLVGSALVLHGLAHASLVISAFGTGPTWLVAPLVTLALPGFVAAGFGVLGLPLLRRCWRKCLLIAVTASMLLLLLFGHGFALPGLAVDFALALVALDLPEFANRRDSGGVIRRRVRGVGVALGAAALLWVTLITTFRPLLLHLGTTVAERQAPLPGDPPLRDGGYRLDHGITIHAPVDSVWPWLAQLGQPRAGFYSFEVLERAAGVHIHNADRVHPEWQSIERGDLLRAVQPGYLHGIIDGTPGWRVSEVVPGRAVVLDGWGAFVLVPTDSVTTRFLIRTRGNADPTLVSLLIAPASLFVLEPAHFIMQREMMRGLRDRAERRATAPAAIPVAGRTARSRNGATAGASR